jgi:hypothetical protein
MAPAESILGYIESLPEPRQSDIRRLHELVLALVPGCRLWFLDGRDERGKVVSNPSIGYGTLRKALANGKSREFYQVGISANSAGLSVYLMGITDKAYLKQTYGPGIGKAELTSYCIKFRSLGNVDQEVLLRAIQDGLQRGQA